MANPMTVGELIQALSALPADLPVLMEMGEGIGLVGAEIAVCEVELNVRQLGPWQGEHDYFEFHLLSDGPEAPRRAVVVLEEGTTAILCGVRPHRVVTGGDTKHECSRPISLKTP